jgi:hypothetical protein
MPRIRAQTIVVALVVLVASAILIDHLRYHYKRQERIISTSCGVELPSDSRLMYASEQSSWQDSRHEFAYLIPEPDARALISRCEAGGHRLAAFDRSKVSPAVLKAVGNELTDSEEGSL